MIFLAPGDIVAGRYQILSRLAVQGQCIAYKATDLRTPRVVFLKQYSDIPATDPDRVEALDTDFRTLRERLSPYPQYFVVPHDVMIDKEAAFSASDFIEGSSLSDVLTGESAVVWTGSMSQRKRIARSLATAVDILHTNNIAHLDINPRNILIEQVFKKGRPHLYARLVDWDSVQLDATQLGGRTRQLQTANYAAPEQQDPHGAPHIGRCSDVFSLAVVVAELMLCHHPFPASEKYSYREACLAQRFDLRQSRRSGERWSRRLVRALECALQSATASRATAGRLLTVLNDSEHPLTDERLFQSLRDTGDNGRENRVQLSAWAECAQAELDGIERTVINHPIDLSLGELESAFSWTNLRVRIVPGYRAAAVTVLESKATVYIQSSPGVAEPVPRGQPIAMQNDLTLRLYGYGSVRFAVSP